MDGGVGRGEGVERERAEDDGQQHEQNDLLHGPQGRDVGGVEQVLRGKIPGNPG